MATSNDGRVPGNRRPAGALVEGRRSGLRRLGPPTLVLSVDAVLLMVPVLADAGQITATVAMAGLSLLLLTGGRRYRVPLHLSVLDVIPTLAGRLLVATTAVATIIALRGDRDDVVAFLHNSAMVLVLVAGGRFATTGLIRWSRFGGAGVHRTVLVGGGRLAVDLVDTLDTHPGYGLEVIGFVAESPDQPASDRLPWLGAVSELESVVRDTGADAVLITDGVECTLARVLRTPACLACEVLAVPRLYHLRQRPRPVDRIGSIPVVRIPPPGHDRRARALRRGLDIVVSALLMAVLSPVIAACVVALRIHGGSALFSREPRIGRDGKPFYLLRPNLDRFREHVRTTPLAVAGRVGPAVRRLSRTSLSALAHLCCVLRGDMALIGPHSERPEHAAQLSTQYDCYRLRHRVPGGLTGFAQVNGVSGGASVHERLRYDIYYIENWSFWLDIKIGLLMTAQILAADEN